MTAEVKHTPGRWVFTTACPKFEGHSNVVRAYDGSIHAGWEDSPEFETSEQFYDWAKAECARRNVLESAASDLLVAVQRCLNFIEGTEAEFGEEFECGNIARAAIARATGAS